MTRRQPAKVCTPRRASWRWSSNWRERDCRVLYVLSFGDARIRRFVTTGKRFDQPLVDYLNASGLPYVDLLTAHVDELAKTDGDLKAYLARYFIGHYNPLGNFFCAMAMKDRLVKMLDPPPPAYAPVPEP